VLFFAMRSKRIFFIDLEGKVNPEGLRRVDFGRMVAEFPERYSMNQRCPGLDSGLRLTQLSGEGPCRNILLIGVGVRCHLSFF
jgi:hypothetical protein